MRKIKNPFFILFAMTVFTVSISAQAGSFDIYMNNIKTRLPEIRKNEVNLLQVKNEIYKTKSVDDTYFNINASYFNADDKQLSMDSFIDTTRSGLGTNFSVKKKFSATGTDLIFESSFYGQKYRRNGTNIFDNVYEPMFSMGFSQPLLYDRFGFLDKFIIQNAKEKYKLEKLKAEINNKELLTYYAKLYFDVLAYNEILNLIDKNIENGNVLYKQIKDKHKKGLVETF
jgi:adenylate cyclase class IV